MEAIWTWIQANSPASYALIGVAIFAVWRLAQKPAEPKSELEKRLAEPIITTVPSAAPPKPALERASDDAVLEEIDRRKKELADLESQIAARKQKLGRVT